MCVCLDGLAAQGLTPVQTSLIVEAVLAERVNAPALAALFDVVLSGPEISGAPTADTGAAIVGLIQEAQRRAGGSRGLGAMRIGLRVPIQAVAPATTSGVIFQ